ncbi:MAG: DUF3570 domain-containing protein [Myxococcota bacterium]
MQLRRGSTIAAAALVLGLSAQPHAQAESGVGTTTTVFHEGFGADLNMTVVTPSVNAQADAGDHLNLHADWEADVVSGASVAVVDAPSSDVDVISSATQLEDTRHTAGGGIRILDDVTSLDLAYHYGFENDYRSHSFSITARAELFERNTAFELSYARGFDQVCNLAQPEAQEAVDRQRLPSSEGCFGGDDRVSLDVDLHTLQAAWTQAWKPILITQLTLTTQVLDGYQANPYRAVFLGRAAAQEHHPDTRIRYAAGLGMNLWVEPLGGAFQVTGRLYRDTWDVESVTAELAYEQNVAAGLRLRARGRYYLQSGAVFYSDDYTLFPKGKYFTGDRELSPMSSWIAGGSLHWTVPAGEDGRVLGFLGGLNLVGKADFIMYAFDDFHYGEASVPNDRALVATFGVESVF